MLTGQVHTSRRLQILRNNVGPRAASAYLETLGNDVGFRVAGLAGGWLEDMHFLEQAAHEV